MLAFLPPFQNDSVRQFTVEQRLELGAIDGSGEAEGRRALPVPLRRFPRSALGVVVVLGVVGPGLGGGVQDADGEHQNTSPWRET